MISAPRIASPFAAGLAAVFVLAGCVDPAGTASVPPEPTVREPSALARQGLHEEAAAAWLAEAEGATAGAAALRLRAAEAWWKAGRADRAEETARAIDPAGLEPADRSRRALLLVRTALEGGAEREAADALPSLEAMLALPEAATALELAARAAHRAGRPADELRFRVVLDPRLADPEANRKALWSLVHGLPEVSLRNLRGAHAPGSDSHATGWIELAWIARTHRMDFPAFSTAVGLWRKRFPDHPAEPSVLPGLLAGIRSDDSPPSHIALLLPLSGTFASAAAAVRDGFLAAWYAAEPAERPVVSVYDTAGGGSEAVFRAAIAEGADFVVGPLSKKSITRVASLAERTAPVLLLNALDDDTRPVAGSPVYQFALSPEDEARAVASFARRRGYDRAGVLVPETQWGARVADAFTDRWEASGAVVVARASYRGAAEDLAGPVREVLGIDVGDERAKRLRRVLQRSIVHGSLPGGDLDFIFLAGFPREARLLRPQIVFLRAPDLPVLSTSHVFGGVPDPQHDLDLDGIVFSDMPWVLGPASGENALRERILALWPAANEGFVRYYAFGADAYRLQRWIHRLASRPGEASVAGHTGRLTVGSDGRVRIEMGWARFRGGVPEPLSP